MKRKETIKKKFSFGGGKFKELSPSREKMLPSTKMLNIRIPFVEALKLNLALDVCIRRLNELNFATKEGKEAAVNLVVNFHNERITISDWSGESK